LVDPLHGSQITAKKVIPATRKRVFPVSTYADDFWMTGLSHADMLQKRVFLQTLPCTANKRGGVSFHPLLRISYRDRAILSTGGYDFRLGHYPSIAFLWDDMRKKDRLAAVSPKGRDVRYAALDF
jgi:hypothetical protein